ncbi:MAG: hypothetical protein R3A11_06205 [Bdellovibrionota bacterium]
MFDAFRTLEKKFSVVLFIQDSELERWKQEIEALGNQKNLHLVVQPCPYEGIEFLYRVDFDVKQAFQSAHKDFFWQAIPLPTSIPSPALEEISNIHYQFLLSILQGQAVQVKLQRKALSQLLSKHGS